jgi:hypothetical protein
MTGPALGSDQPRRHGPDEATTVGSCAPNKALPVTTAEGCRGPNPAVVRGDVSLGLQEAFSKIAYGPGT